MREVGAMRMRLGSAFLLCLLAGVAVSGCSSESSSTCKGRQSESQDGIVISGQGMQEVITSPPANKYCYVKMVVEYRYNDGLLAAHERPDNVSLLFTVEDDEPADTLSQPDPIPIERDDMKFWSVTVKHTAFDRASNPVFYSVYAGSETVVLPEIWVGAVIEYIPHGEPIGLP
jgi:hypothetical protein